MQNKAFVNDYAFACIYEKNLKENFNAPIIIIQTCFCNRSITWLSILHEAFSIAEKQNQTLTGA